jgi:DNA-binding MurR/RpiR family transcriptional regulator
MRGNRSNGGPGVRRRAVDPLLDGAQPLHGLTSLESLKALVASGRVEFPERMKTIGVYAFRNPHEMAFESIQWIADATSPSSVHRFAKILRFSNYSELRKIFQRHIVGRD